MVMRRCGAAPKGKGCIVPTPIKHACRSPAAKFAHLQAGHNMATSASLSDCVPHPVARPFRWACSHLSLYTARQSSGGRPDAESIRWFSRDGEVA
eukprot:COSAG01_NODE_42805_length_436_cov_1.074184_2_plen_94_part_01